MLTQLGKALRHIRLDRDEKLKDMAENLGVTVAYLSAVENGRRKIPGSWIEILANKYNLSEEEVRNIEKFAFDDQPEIPLYVNAATNGQRNLAYSFARKFKDLNEDDVKNLQKFFDQRK